MEKYGYIIRPAAESKKLLIEFPDQPENKEFIKQLIAAFSGINIQVVNYEDLWMNDEIVLNASSDIGNFTIYRDAADYYFITSNDNPDIIPQLSLILQKNIHFIKQ